jgi:hypothetical protein
MEKLDLLKLFQEWGEGRIHENDGGGKFNYDKNYDKNYGKNSGKCHNVLPVSQQ